MILWSKKTSFSHLLLNTLFVLSSPQNNRKSPLLDPSRFRFFPSSSNSPTSSSSSCWSSWSTRTHLLHPHHHIISSTYLSSRIPCSLEFFPSFSNLSHFVAETDQRAMILGLVGLRSSWRHQLEPHRPFSPRTVIPMFHMKSLFHQMLWSWVGPVPDEKWNEKREREREGDVGKMGRADGSWFIDKGVIVTEYQSSSTSRQYTNIMIPRKGARIRMNGCIVSFS